MDGVNREGRRDLSNRLRGLLLGTAAGDALGLPAEGISRRRAQKMFHGRWRHRLILRRGMISDDTEHTIFVAQALLACPADPGAFARRLARSLRGWLLTLPAGIGLATLKAILRLWVGFGPARSGVFSAGNGPAMRVAPIGAFHSFRPELLERFVRASTTLTHTDPRAWRAARAVARLSAWIVRENPAAPFTPPPAATVLALIRDDQDPQWTDILARMENAIGQNDPVGVFMETIGGALGVRGGISGFCYHTVPVAIYAWVRHFGDFEATLDAVLGCGGDTDTAGAIAGALAGATVGESGIPRDWLAGIVDWPRGTELLRKIGDRMASAVTDAAPEPTGPVPYFWPGVLPRNLVFLIIVLAHGLRRLAPPY